MTPSAITADIIASEVRAVESVQTSLAGKPTTSVPVMRINSSFAYSTMKSCPLNRPRAAGVSGNRVIPHGGFVKLVTGREAMDPAPIRSSR